ncbi:MULTISPECIES: type VI secretion system Vgr family protein, partial [unclassified Acinetobacter]
GGSQANQLVMDDTQGQVQVHLKSDHQSSELNLGYITRIPDSSGRKDYRGQGFELRTDGHGVIRSGQGLIVSTYAKANAESFVKNIKESIVHLKNAVDVHKLQSEIAINHQADERSIDETVQVELNKQLSEIKGTAQTKYPELSTSEIVMGSSSGIAVVSEKGTHLSSQAHIALTSKKDISLVSEHNLFASVAKGISLFAQNLGARLFAAKGKIQIEAQSDEIELIADQSVKMMSLKQKIEIVAAEEILLNVNGNYIKIDKNGIEQGSQNSWVVHANHHKFESEKTISYVLPAFKGTNDEAFRILDQHGNVLAGFKYKIVIGDNEEVFKGETDENGFTTRINTGFETKKVTIYQDMENEEVQENNG